MRTLIALLLSIASLQASAKDLDHISLSVVDPVNQHFRGGVFSSEYKMKEMRLPIPNDTAFFYYLFPDGLIIKTSQTNVGERYILAMGIWRIERGMIEIYLAKSDDWRRPTEEWALLKVESSGAGLAYILVPPNIKIDAGQPANCLERSYGLVAPIEAQDFERSKFLSSFLPELIRTK